MGKHFLAGLSRAEFLRRHWQKKPLLARNALPKYAHAFTREALFELAQRDDVESRLVQRTRGRWRVDHGPFHRRALQRLPRRNWTLLVQGVEVALSHGAGLLREFKFLPYARLDDLMVSYAAPGGGVGAHFDSYDVFLVQTTGERRWRVSRQQDLELKADAPLKILENFRPDREWLVSPGDVLYLPPRYAHEGVAIGECVTCSVGFRAPASQELASRFVDFLQDRLELDGIYSDPAIAPTTQPARIPAPMIEHTTTVLRSLSWSRPDVLDFLGRYLSEPKNNVVFERPSRPPKRADFERQVLRRGIHLSAATRMLFHGNRIFVNGEAFTPDRATTRVLATLANVRELVPPLHVPAGAWQLLYAWYVAGYIASNPPKQAHHE
jgi:50S ribosomal protein L16 3-hydroxylase